MKKNAANMIRALRLPFLSASVLPFLFGSLLWRGAFNAYGFSLGLASLVSMHLAANLINDYADSRSGADWIDKRFYKFFGGSKLIQEGIFFERFYLYAAIVFTLLSLLSAVALFLLLESFVPVILGLFIILLGWSYSTRPLALSYRRMGEIVIFLLFGPIPVMGGYFIQSGLFPETGSFVLSLPFGFLTTAILFANEVPDFIEDKKVRKMTWVSVVGIENSYLLYYLLIALAFLAVIFGVSVKYLRLPALFCLAAGIPAFKAGMILKDNYFDKTKLAESSKLTIAAQALAGVVLIISVLL